MLWPIPSTKSQLFASPGAAKAFVSVNSGNSFAILALVRVRGNNAKESDVFAIACLSKAGAKPPLSDTPSRNDLCLLVSAAWRIAATPLIGSFECPTAYYMGIIRESFYPLHSNQWWLLFPKGLADPLKCLGCKEVAFVLSAAASSVRRENLRFRVSNVFPTSDAFDAFNGWVERRLLSA